MTEQVPPQTDNDKIEIYRRCPICWGDDVNGSRGVGVAYSTQGATRYYRCTRTLTEAPPCGFTWKAIIKPPQVTSIEFNNPPISH